MGNDEKQLKILVADDTPYILKMVEMRLNLSGHQILKAKDGKEAVQLAKKYKPDVVLLDVMMPVMNGLEALMKIKELSPNIPIAMISASTANQHLKEALNKGAMGYITKPIDFDELNKLIEDIIQKMKFRKIQSEMENMSRLAALGEISGRVAHEILNPITAVLSKLDTIIQDSSKTSDDRLDVIKEIIQVWKHKYVMGDLQSYLNQNIDEDTSGYTNAQQDFNDLDDLISELIKKEKERQKKYNFLKKHLLRVINIVDNLRGLARKSQTMEEVNVNKLLSDTKELLHDSLWKKGIEVVENYDESLPTIMADPNELLQVFTNLTKNAADAIEMAERKNSENKKIVYQTTVNNNHLEIRIKDKGIGIEQKNWETIFESDYTTKSRKKGTGLGLSISRRFIRNFGGDIVVENSVPDHGTIILIQLPIKK